MLPPTSMDMGRGAQAVKDMKARLAQLGVPEARVSLCVEKRDLEELLVKAEAKAEATKKAEAERQRDVARGMQVETLVADRAPAYHRRSTESHARQNLHSLR